MTIDMHPSKKKFIESLARLQNLAEPFTALDPTGLSELAINLTKSALQERRSRQNIQIQKYYAALLASENEEFITPENSSELSKLDFSALLQACAADIEFEKTEIYAQLTKSIAVGAVDKDLRRHFILTLHKLTYEELCLLRLAYVADKENLIHNLDSYPLTGCRILKEEYLGEIKSISLEEFNRRKLIRHEGLTSIGEKFVESIFKKDYLTASSLGYETWQKYYILTCFSDEPSSELIDTYAKTFKALRIRCHNGTIDSLAERGPRNCVPGTLFIGNFSNLSHEHEQLMINWSKDLPGSCIWIHDNGKISGGIDLIKAIKIHPLSNISELASSIAKKFGFSVQDEILANR